MPNMVGLVTTDVLCDRDPDLGLLLEALGDAGVAADAPHWLDPSVDWSAYALVVMRSPWDYQYRATEFLAWLDSTSRVTRILNCPDVIRWNLDKRYLAEMQGEGVPVVPTQFCASPAAVRTAIAGITEGEFVVKPTVSAASQNTGRFVAGDPAAFELADAILALAKTVMVQPFIGSVAIEGECAFVYFDGRFSHAFRKGPLLTLGGGLVHDDFFEPVNSVQPHPGQRELADAALRAVPRIIARHGCTCLPGTPLYARIDVVSDAELGPLLLEAELFEPSYFVATAPSSAKTFAEAVAQRLR